MKVTISLTHFDSFFHRFIARCESSNDAAKHVRLLGHRNYFGATTLLYLVEFFKRETAARPDLPRLVSGRVAISVFGAPKC
jgi:hypothetical protein